MSSWRLASVKEGRKEGRNPDHNLCPVGKAVSRTFLTALRPWPKADAENLPSELGCERCAMLAEEPAMAGETMVIISIIYIAAKPISSTEQPHP